SAVGPSHVSASFTTASLWGTVTFAPRTWPSRIRATAAGNACGVTSTSSYECGRPSARNAALCMAGDSECSTGCPSSCTIMRARACRSLVPVLDPVRLLLLDRLGERVIAGAVPLRDEEEVVGGLRLRRGLQRRQ